MNEKHALARIIMQAVAAGTQLPQGEQTALARELALAADRRSIDPWAVKNGGLRSNS